MTPCGGNVLLDSRLRGNDEGGVNDGGDRHGGRDGHGGRGGSGGGVRYGGRGGRSTGLRRFYLGLSLFLCAVFASSPVVSAEEDPLARLHRFLQMKTFKAAFSQVVYDAKQSVIVDSLGTVVLSRPGRFRWEYAEPNRQSIVSDGLNLIIYDPDLKQASVQPVAAALGDAPITLLMRSRPVFDRFEVKREGRRAGLDWIALTPKVQDLEFTSIRLGLDDEKVVRMQLLDHFEQTTEIHFLRPELSPELAADAFQLHLPETVDVIGEYVLPVVP